MMRRGSLEKRNVFIYGASGHAKVVIDILEKQGLFDISGLVDDAPALRGGRLFEYPVLGGREVLPGLMGEDHSPCAMAAIGSNRARQEIARLLCDYGFEMISAVHPSAQLGRSVSVAGGTVVMGGAVINPDVKIGRNVIVNTKATVDHDCLVGDGVHLGPGSTLCGNVTVAEETFVGAGATILPNVRLGRRVTVGAGATVVCDIADGQTVVGTPARALRRTEGENTLP